MGVLKTRGSKIIDELKTMYLSDCDELYVNQ
jgi:hypothetical protein